MSKYYNSRLADVMLIEGDYEGLADEVGKPNKPTDTDPSEEGKISVHLSEIFGQELDE